MGYSGTKAEAEAIKRHLGEFLRDTLTLDLSPEKTLITHATTDAAHFLGYSISVSTANDQHDQTGRRSINGRVLLRLPAEVVTKKRAAYEHDGTPRLRPERLLDSDFDIVDQYQAEYRGLVQYYLLAHNVTWCHRLHWTMQRSLLKTLASKHKVSMQAMRRKYSATTDTPYGTLRCLRVVLDRGGTKKPLVAQFGGIPLRRQRTTVLVDHPPPIIRNGRTELIKRLFAHTCELCGSTEDCEVHHIRKLADLKMKGRSEKPVWIQRMAARRRKTLVVCRSCHVTIHAGRPSATLRN